jgi:excisionase family DNA binding protein
VKEAAVAIGLSRREVYRLMDADEIESVEQGRRRLVVVKSLHDFAERLRKEAAQRRKKVAA